MSASSVWLTKDDTPMVRIVIPARYAAVASLRTDEMAVDGGPSVMSIATLGTPERLP